MVSNWHKAGGRKTLGSAGHKIVFPDKETCIKAILSEIAKDALLKDAARLLFSMDAHSDIYKEIRRDPRIIRALHDRAVRLNATQSVYFRMKFTEGA